MVLKRQKTKPKAVHKAYSEAEQDTALSCFPFVFLLPLSTTHLFKPSCFSILREKKIFSLFKFSFSEKPKLAEVKKKVSTKI